MPTNAEWDVADTALTGWSNRVHAYESTLKLPSSGYRSRSGGSFTRQGTYGHYWSSSLSGTSARMLDFNSSSASVTTLTRGHGLTVRCIKD